MAHLVLSWFGVPGLGIFPDTLHILDLACSRDCVLSALIIWTHSGRGQRPTRQEKLHSLRDEYLAWCRSAGVSEQASNKLWNAKVLMPKRGEFPEVSSKVMKGAACRFMVHWCAHEALRRAEVANDQQSWQLGFNIFNI